MTDTTGLRARSAQGWLIVIAWIAVIALDVAGWMGISRLRFEDSLEKSFESNDPHFLQYMAFREKFPSYGREVYLLLETDDFAPVDRLAAVADFLIDLQLADGVEAALSAFSVPILGPDGEEISLMPDREMGKAEAHARLYRLRLLQPALDRFLSRDNRRMLVAVQLSKGAAGPEFEGIRALAREALEPHGIAATLTGFAVMRESTVKRLFGDFVMLVAFGAIAATIIAALALTSIRLAILTAFVASTSVLWVFILLGWGGYAINVVTIALPVLVLVLAFADALHLTVEMRRQVLQGADHPAVASLVCIAPACILAAATTAIAFGALALSPSALVRELGVAGTIAVTMATAAVMAVHLLVFATFHHLGLLERIFAGRRGEPARATRWEFLAGFAVRAPRRVFSVGLGLLAVCGALYATAEPNFSLYDNIKENDGLRDAAFKIEESFGPFGSLKYLADVNRTDPDPDIRQAHNRLKSAAPGREVVSLVTFEGAVGGGIDALPEPFLQRFLSEDGGSTLLSVPFPYRDAQQTREIADEIGERLEAGAGPGNILPTPVGIEAMTSYVSDVMLRDLNRTFLIAVAISGLTIALWLRDPLAGLLSLIPNVLPIAMVGAWLAVSGRGLEFASGIALTIAFGLAIDDTVHLLNRQRLQLGGTVWGSPAVTLRSVHDTGPALVITSAVLAIGLLGTQFATLPSVAYFGALSIAVFLLALIGVLFFMPACLVLGARWLGRENLE